jgi:hypothetical protein
MSELVRARVEERLVKLRLGAVAQRLDGILSAAARAEPTYLDFLDQLLAEETDAKQKKRVAMGIQIAHFPAVRTLEEFDFKFQPSVDQKLVRELATGRFVAGAENVLLFGPPGVGKTHLAVALGRAVVEAGHSALFVLVARPIPATDPRHPAALRRAVPVPPPIGRYPRRPAGPGRPEGGPLGRAQFRSALAPSTGPRPPPPPHLAGSPAQRQREDCLSTAQEARPTGRPAATNPKVRAPPRSWSRSRTR